jgi:hypothetical protein
MIRITNAIQKVGENGPFVLLELSGDLEMVQSMNSLKFYATVRKCSVTTTVDLETAKAFIGKQMPGRIVRAQSEQYDYTTASGEVIPLNYKWEYVPEERPAVSSSEKVSQSVIA